MAILSIKQLEVGFGGKKLLDGIDLVIEPGERVAILGRNGAGKSTLMKLIKDRCDEKGDWIPEGGDITVQSGVKVSYLPQIVPDAMEGDVLYTVLNGLGENGRDYAAYRELSRKKVKEKLNDDEEIRMRELETRLSDRDGWKVLQSAEDVITRLGLVADSMFETMSAGGKRLVMFAKGLASNPDLFMLDEPTNHLDINAIAIIEGILEKYDKTLLFITHDRKFMKKIGKRVVEIDRGKLYSFKCDYETYINRKEALEEAEEKNNVNFDKKLASEEVWIRQGLKARRTRNMGRFRHLQQMREERRARREHEGSVKMAAQKAERSGRLVIEADAINYAISGKPIIKDFSVAVMRGDKVGIMGPNGAGKTTLLRNLLGEIKYDSGRIRHGTNLTIAYFDQLRETLDETKTVQENVADGKDTVLINGKQKHVIGYLKEFLFAPERSRSPVSVLSGGERNRLLLARLFTRPFNLLILDEPTNDLDIETLELLEDILVRFEGTIITVSHDRDFLNNVVTSTLVFEGNGLIGEYVGGYDDWLIQKKPDAEIEKAVQDKGKKEKKPEKAKEKTERPKKLGYMEKRELEELPARIEALEKEQEELFALMSDPDFYKKDAVEIARNKDRLALVEVELEKCFIRWEELEALKS